MHRASHLQGGGVRFEKGAMKSAYTGAERQEETSVAFKLIYGGPLGASCQD